LKNKLSGGDTMELLIILFAGGFFGLFGSAMGNSDYDTVSFVALLVFVTCIAVAVITLLNLIGMS
jgi:hypothetical protein